MKLTGICLITEDVGRLSRFYQQVLHTTAEGDDTHTEIHVNGASLFIYAKTAAMHDMKFDFSTFSGSGNMTLMFRVDDVDQEYERIKGFDVDFITIPTKYPWGSRAVHFRDPDGNIVDFYTPPT